MVGVATQIIKRGPLIWSKGRILKAKAIYVLKLDHANGLDLKWVGL
jgi:hypothetical protein